MSLYPVVDLQITDRVCPEETFYDASERDERLLIFYGAIEMTAKQHGARTYPGFGAKFLEHYNSKSADETTRKVIEEASILVGKAKPRNIREIATLLEARAIQIPEMNSDGFITSAVPVLIVEDSDAEDYFDAVEAPSEITAEPKPAAPKPAQPKSVKDDNPCNMPTKAPAARAWIPGFSFSLPTLSTPPARLIAAGIEKTYPEQEDTKSLPWPIVKDGIAAAERGDTSNPLRTAMKKVIDNKWIKRVLEEAEREEKHPALTSLIARHLEVLTGQLK